MELRKFAARTVYLMTVFAAAGCADGTGEALTPTFPTVETNTTNADGTRLKASAPQPTSPVSSSRVTSLTPTLRLANGTAHHDPNAQLSYVFEIFDGTTKIHQSDPIPEGTPETAMVVPENVLQANKTYAWRAYARYGDVSGSLSDMASFQSPLPAAAASGGSSRPGPVPCAGNSGRDIIACVSDAFPERLAKTSLGRRYDNMEFLRDTIIATGKCRGLNFGRNNKRGTAVISRDFLVWRSNVGKNGRDRGVDIASGYDDAKTTLKLTWQVFDGDKNWGHPFYGDYGPVDCTGVN